MRTTLDFSPFTRSTVGFDRMLRLLDSIGTTGEAPSYPPYNIVKLGDDQYRISVAVAGFGEDELEVKTQDGQLTIKSVAAKDGGKDDATYLHRGIARRAFELRFSLADYIEVTGGHLDNGMLHVDLVRNVPEAMKPRTIEIAGPTGKKAISGKQAA